jgi:hypothetical protein
LPSMHGTDDEVLKLPSARFVRVLPYVEASRSSLLATRSLS